MKIEYVDESREVVAWVENGQLFRRDGSLVGQIDEIKNEVHCAETGDSLVLYHEGLYLGPNQRAIAWKANSEFKK